MSKTTSVSGGFPDEGMIESRVHIRMKPSEPVLNPEVFGRLVSDERLCCQRLTIDSIALLLSAGTVKRSRRSRNQDFELAAAFAGLLLPRPEIPVGSRIGDGSRAIPPAPIATGRSGLMASTLRFYEGQGSDPVQWQNRTKARVRSSCIRTPCPNFARTYRWFFS